MKRKEYLQAIEDGDIPFVNSVYMTDRELTPIDRQIIHDRMASVLAHSLRELITKENLSAAQHIRR